MSFDLELIGFAFLSRLLLVADLNKYKFTIEAGPEEVDRKSGSLDMILYPEELAYAESGYPCGEKFMNDNLFGILISKNGTSCDDNGYYDNLDAYICTLGDDWMPTYEQWFDIANRYLAPYYIPDTQANVFLMSSMNRYEKIPMKRGYEIATIDRLMKSGAIPLFWFAIDDELITLYMAESEKALDRIF